MLGTILGQFPIGTIDPGTSGASFDPYAGVFDQPDLDLIFLLEFNFRANTTVNPRIVELVIGDNLLFGDSSTEDVNP